MNLNMILRMILRPLMNKLINKGVSAAFDRKDRSARKDPQTGEENSPWEKNSQKRVKQSMRAARRLTRF